jgi:hypothetical protein
MEDYPELKKDANRFIRIITATGPERIWGRWGADYDSAALWLDYRRLRGRWTRSWTQLRSSSDPRNNWGKGTLMTPFGPRAGRSTRPGLRRRVLRRLTRQNRSLVLVIHAVGVALNPRASCSVRSPDGVVLGSTRAAGCRRPPCGNAAHRMVLAAGAVRLGGRLLTGRVAARLQGWAAPHRRAACDARESARA